MKKNFILILVLMLFLVACNYPLDDDDKRPVYDELLKVYFINVGQADSCLIILPNQETILIDAGLDHATIFDGVHDFPSWNNILTIFEVENITKIDHLLITHFHIDHTYFIVKILEEYQVNNVYTSGSTSTNISYYNILTAVSKANAKMFSVFLYDKLINIDLILWQVVATQAIDNPENPNTCSVVTKLSYDQTSFMFTGDSGSYDNDGEKIALNCGLDLKSNVLKVGHHGSLYSSSQAFLDAVKPQYAVITTSSYTTTGHPHQATLNRLNNMKAKIFQSKNDGTILFTSDGSTLRYTTHVGE